MPEQVVSEQFAEQHDDEGRAIAVKQELMMKGGGVFYLIIEREREDGQREREVVAIENLITDLGLDIFVRNLVGISPVAVDYIVLSDSTTTPNPSETAMPATIIAAAAATKSRPSARQVRWQVSWARGAVNGTIGSIGLCSDATGANLFARVVLSPAKSVGANDTVSVIYDLTLNRSS